MYTGSFESEMQFLTDLAKNEADFLKKLLEKEVNPLSDEDKVIFARKCPKCEVGNVLTHCTEKIENGKKVWSFSHDCDSCGEHFEIEKIWADIF